MPNENAGGIPGAIERPAQYPTATSIDNDGTAHDISGKALGAVNTDAAQPASAGFDFGFGSQSATQPTQTPQDSGDSRFDFGFGQEHDFGFDQPPAKSVVNRFAGSFNQTLSGSESLQELKDKASEFINKPGPDGTVGTKYEGYAKVGDLVEDLAAQAWKGQQYETSKGTAQMAQLGIRNKAEGAIRYLQGGVPFLGPALGSIEDHFARGEYAEGLGTAAALLLPGAAEEHGMAAIDHVQNVAVKGKAAVTAKSVLDTRYTEAANATRQATEARERHEDLKEQFADGKVQKAQVDEAGTNASAAAANATKADKALQEAKAAKSNAVVEANKAARAAKQATEGKKSQVVTAKDAAGAKEDWEHVFPPSKRAPYTPEDTAVGDRYLEAVHRDTPLNTVGDVHEALDNSVESVDKSVKQAIEPYKQHPIASNVNMAVVDALEPTNKLIDGFTQKGVDSLENYNLTDPTMDEATQFITRLNKELKTMKDKTTPEYVAKSAAVQSLREGLFDQASELGVDNIGEMRSDMASLIRLRENAAQQLYKGDVKVRSSGQSGFWRKAAQKAVLGAGTAAGAYVGTHIPLPGTMELGAAAGGYYANKFGQKLSPADLTRNELVQRRFAKTVATGVNPEPTVGVSPVLPKDALPPVPRDFSPLHAELASHYGEVLGKTAYKDLENRFYRDINDKTQNNVPLEPAEKTLLVKLNQQGSTDAVAAQAAQAEAAAKGQSVQPSATLPRNYEKPLEVPSRADGLGTSEVLQHELVHDYVAKTLLGEKLPSLGVRSHLHDYNAENGNTATAAFDWSHYYDDNGKLNANKIGSDIDDLTTMLVSGGVANELWHDIPLDANKALSGDIESIQKLFKELDFSPEEQQFIVDRAGRRAKEMLSQPNIQDLIEQHVTGREPGLKEELHFSPERLEQVHKDLKGNNEKASKSAGDAGVSDRTSKQDDAGRKGKVQEELVGSIGEARKGNAKGGRRPPEADAAIESKSEELNPALSKEERDIGTLEPYSFGYMRPDGSIEQGNRFGNPDVMVHDDLARVKGDRMDRVLSAPGGVKYGTGKDRGFISIENRDPKTVSNAIKVVESLPNEEIDFEFGRPGQKPVHFDGTAKQVTGKVRRYFAEPESYDLGEDLNPAVKDSGKTTGVKEHDDAIRAAGGIPVGHLPADARSGLEAHALYNDPVTDSTMVTPFGKLTRDEVTKNMNENRAAYAPGNAVKSAKETGGFTFNPKTGQVPKTGYQVELFPERRGSIAGDVPTTDEIRDFTEKNQDVLAQHPELHVGGYGKELNLSARFADETAAKNAAKKLDQISIWDNKNAQEINTGGTGVQTEFGQYPVAQRIQDLKAGTELGQPGRQALPETELGDPNRRPIAAPPETAPAVPADYAKLSPVEQFHQGIRNDTQSQDLSAAIPRNAEDELAQVQPELEAREARRVERQRDLNRSFGERTRGEDFNPAVKSEWTPPAGIEKFAPKILKARNQGPDNESGLNALKQH